jgi:integrase
MASLVKGSNGRWRARYFDQVHRQHERNFRRKTDAQRWLDEQTSSLVQGTWIDPERSKTTVSEVADTWMSTPDWKATTKARNRGNLDNYILPRWGAVKLRDVAHDDVQAWVNGLSVPGPDGPGLAPNTVRKVAGNLSSILSAAVASKRLPSNPMDDIRLPAAASKRRRYLSAEEVEQFADAAGDRHKLVVYVLAYTGLRIGELAALRIKDVDTVRRRLRVEESMTEVNGKTVFSDPKDYQRRTVPYPSFLQDMIVDQVKERDPDDFLFASPKGGVLRYRNMRRGWWDVAAEDAGLEGLTPHSMRHTAASLAVHSGASVLALQRMLGHEKPSMTLDVYSDLFDDDLDALADRLTATRTEAVKGKSRGDDEEGEASETGDPA